MARKKLTREEKLNREIKKDANRLMNNIFKTTPLYDAMKPVRKVKRVTKNAKSIANDLDDLFGMFNKNN